MMDEINADMDKQELAKVLEYFKQVHENLLDFVDNLSLCESEIPNEIVVETLLQILKNDD
jgi:hypothetical protein